MKRTFYLFFEKQRLRSLGVVVDVQHFLVDHRRTPNCNSPLHNSLELVLSAFSAVPQALLASRQGGYAGYSTPLVACVLSPDPLDETRMAVRSLCQALRDFGIPSLPSCYDYQFREPLLKTRVGVPTTALTRPIRRYDVVAAAIDRMSKSFDDIALVTNSSLLQLYFSTLPGCRSPTEKRVHIFNNANLQNIGLLSLVTTPASTKRHNDVPPAFLHDFFILTGVGGASKALQSPNPGKVLGVPSIGPSRALALLREFGSIEGIVDCGASYSRVLSFPLKMQQDIIAVARYSKKLSEEALLLRPNKDFYLKAVDGPGIDSLNCLTVHHHVRNLPDFSSAAVRKAGQRGIHFKRFGNGSLSKALREAQLVVANRSFSGILSPGPPPPSHHQVNAKDPAAVAKAFDELMNRPIIDVTELEEYLAAFPKGCPSRELERGLSLSSSSTAAAERRRKRRRTESSLLNRDEEDAKTDKDDVLLCSNPNLLRPRHIELRFVAHVLLVDVSDALKPAAAPQQNASNVVFYRVVSMLRDVAAAYEAPPQEPETVVDETNDDGSSCHQQRWTIVVPVAVPVLDPQLGAQGQAVSQYLHSFGIPALPRPQDYKRFKKGDDCRVRDVLEYLRLEIPRRAGPIHGAPIQLAMEERSGKIVVVGDSCEPRNSETDKKTLRRRRDDSSPLAVHLVVHDGEPHIGGGRQQQQQNTTSFVLTIARSVSQAMILVPCTLPGSQSGLSSDAHRWVLCAKRVSAVTDQISLGRIRDLFARFGTLDNVVRASHDTARKVGRRQRKTKMRKNSKATVKEDPPVNPRCASDGPTCGRSNLAEDTLEAIRVVAAQSDAIRLEYLNVLANPEAYISVALGTSPGSVDDLFLAITGFAEDTVAAAAARASRLSLEGSKSSLEGSKSSLEGSKSVASTPAVAAMQAVKVVAVEPAHDQHSRMTAFLSSLSCVKRQHFEQ
jgi:hypothetical protein